MTNTSTAVYIPIILGSIIKIYDDSIDLKWNVTPVIHQSMSSLIVVLFTWIAVNDFYLAFACFILTLFDSGIDAPFWKSLVAVTGVITLLNISSAGDNMFPHILLTLLALSGILIFTWVEARIFPEEVSMKKIGVRLLSIIVFGFCATSIATLPFPEFSKLSIRKACLILVGYLITSVGTMTYYNLRN